MDYNVYILYNTLVYFVTLVTSFLNCYSVSIINLLPITFVVLYWRNVFKLLLSDLSISVLVLGRRLGSTVTEEPPWTRRYIEDV